MEVDIYMSGYIVVRNLRIWNARSKMMLGGHCNTSLIYKFVHWAHHSYISQMKEICKESV